MRDHVWVKDRGKYSKTIVLHNDLPTPEQWLHIYGDLHVKYTSTNCISHRKNAVQCGANAGMLGHTLTLFDQNFIYYPLEYRYDFCGGQLLYRQSNCWQLLLLTFNQNIHHYESWRSGNAHVQATSFVNTASHYCNALSYELHNAGSITTFSKWYKRHILCALLHPLALASTTNCIIPYKTSFWNCYSYVFVYSLKISYY